MAENLVVKILLIALLVLLNEMPVESRSLDVESYCYEKDILKPQHKMFSSKTAYEFIRGTPNDFEFNLPNCTPIQFWMLCRHGTRLPNGNSIKDFAKLIYLRDQIIKNHETEGELCAEDLDNLKNWQWDFNITADHEEYLVPQGYADLKNLAERYQSRFPDLLGLPYSESHYHFRHTDTERTRRSAEAFTQSLFGAKIDIAEPPENDTLLMPYRFCPRWENQEYKGEYYKFVQSEIYQEMVRKISTRLGFKETLEQNIVGIIWDMCRFDKAWKLEETSPWCAAFTLDHVKILEYQEDLIINYGSGFGNEFNRELGCGGVKDMLETFKTTISGTTGAKVTAYFSHSTMLTFVQTALGIGEDPKPLTAEDFLKNGNRNFRMSQLDPFANNIVAVLYKCESSEIHQHVVLLFQNEKPIQLEGCNNGVCSWETLLRKYGNVLNRCSLDGCYETEP